MHRARPTLRCLVDDLAISIPTVDIPLDEIEHPLLAKAVAQFSDRNGRRERIIAVDDNILLKVKIQRWRGAVWLESDRPWLVAGGRREAGSADDFYAWLASEGQVARARHNRLTSSPLRSETHTGHLLPNRDDHVRLRAEAGARLVRRLETAIPGLVRRSLVDGREHSAGLGAFEVGLQVRADRGHETYVALRISGSVGANLVGLVLDIVPGCERDGWYPEDRMPDRGLNANEQVWSNVMDPLTAAKLLNDPSI